MSLRIPPWPPRWPEIEASVLRSVRSGQWGNYHSETCESLRNELSRRFQASHVRLCCSGSAAIEIALRAAGVGPGDEVIVCAFDYPGNFRSIELLGARPVLVDLVPDSVQLDADQLSLAASDAVKAVIVSHLFGVAADISRIRELCENTGWVLIEDACQVPGMKIADPSHESRQPDCQAMSAAGSLGHFGTLSFGGSKPLTCGSGGALLTNDPKLAARLGPLLDRPSDVMPLSPLQAAALEPQLDPLDRLNRHRRETVSFIEASVLPRLDHWQWLSPAIPSVLAAHYKVAWAAKNSAHRNRIVTQSARLGLPIGEGFHAMTRCSQRRCRKPVPLPHAARLGESLFVLDHTALLVQGEHYAPLGELLVELHESTRQDG